MILFEVVKLKYIMIMFVEDVCKKVKLIKLFIEELGIVNLGVIDEYECVVECYIFLLEQRDDLEEVKVILYQFIIEMDEEMKKCFFIMFEGIRMEF